ncbi:MAG: MBL fold metallo-hydrolase [Candidatus Melainabacteria bacterium HGW-Melainabacteria-1]|nr:MAG: MBL fold metallo-hydrolase [Candidatus Melainabacteria bacterium HGW-Melainabacteria-1]
MKVKFWGVRGSVPTPWAEAMQVGGNTSCVQVLTALEDLIVLDAGTGLRLLGKELIQQAQHRGRRVHLLLSHTHWDHIQGLPFFGLLNYPDNQLKIYGADKADKTLEAVVCAQMNYEYFPVTLRESAASIAFESLPEGSFALGPLQIQVAGFNHPGGVYGYRIRDQDRVLVYATDMEYTQDNLDPRLIAFAQGADLLIYDAQYTSEEHRIKKGWGHSTHLAAAQLAHSADVGELYLFSHDPDHSDQTLEAMAAEAQRIFARTQLAREGLTVSVGRQNGLEAES